MNETAGFRLPLNQRTVPNSEERAYLMSDNPSNRSNSSVETGYLDVAGGRLYYEVTGAGYPLLLVHADVSDNSMWDEQVNAFAEQYRVVRFDKRGFGKTTSEDGPFSYRQDMAALLAHLGIEKAAILGLSNGGTQVVDFTLEHPELVDALIVVAGAASGDEQSFSNPTETETALFSQYETLEEQKDYEGLVKLGVHVWCDGPNQPEGRAAASVRERIAETLRNNYRLHQEKLEPQPLEPPAAGRLSEIHVPTLVIVGDFDESGTVAAANTLAKGIPGAQHAVFQGVAHMVNMEQPERFNTLVLDFLAQALPQ